MKLSRKFLNAVVLCAIGIFPAARVSADYPKHEGKYVNDFAQVLKAPDSASIQKTFAELEKLTGIEATLVTVPSIAHYGTGDTTVEAFATHLFNTWGIGRKRANNGALILVAVKDR